MGDSQIEPLRVDFDRNLKLEFHGSTVTSDAGLLAYRELDDALGLTSAAANGLHDTRTGQNTQHRLLALLRQSIYSRLAGYEYVNDAERLCLGPPCGPWSVAAPRTTRLLPPARWPASRPRLSAARTTSNSLMDLSGQSIDHAHRHRTLTKLILDMDSSVSETYGHQQGSAYNGHFGCTCYHPLFLFNQFGDLERVLLRRGNRGSAKYWRRVLLPVIARYRDLDIPKFFRRDAAFAGSKLLRLLEQEEFRYAIRIKANAVLERKIAHLPRRPVGRPSRKPKVFYFNLRYRAGWWECARRVVVKVEWHAGELFPRVGFIVTNLKWRAKKVVRFYNRRGTAEQWIMEGKNAVKWTKLSCRRFKDNAARFHLFALAYHQANFLRHLVLQKPIEGWTLTTLREKLVKIVAKVVSHAKYIVFHLAEVAVPRRTVRDDCGADPAATAGMCLGVRFAVLDKAVRASPPYIRGALCGPSSGDEQGSGVLCAGPCRDGAGAGHAFGGESLQPLRCAGSLSCRRCNRGSRARSSGKDRFSRRMHYVVEFPLPDDEHRELPWRGMFPPEVPLGSDVDVRFLAKQFPLAGGDIKNVALDAAFLAAQDGQVVTMKQLSMAMARQMMKQGRIPSPTEFKQYHALVAQGE